MKPTEKHVISHEGVAMGAKETRLPKHEHLQGTLN